MAVSKAQTLAVLKYRAKAYDRLSTDVPKGKRDEYNAAAKSLSLSLSKLIQNGVEEYISNHAGEKIPPSVPPTPENKLSADDRRLLDSAGKLTPDARKQLVKFLEILTARAATISDTKGGDEND